MQVEKRVTELVLEKIADRPELYIVDVKFLPNKRLIIQVDGDQGISIQDCVAISRHVGFHLEEENAIEGAYHLEVTSPGVGEPLLLNRQYHKNIGRDLSIKLQDGTLHEGKLLAVNESTIQVEEKVKEKGKKVQLVETTFELDQIIETKVLISFK
ncbi:MAG: ribosome assembly cofactor RimP [Pedobacter sp.]|nr:MAG: ribosome assembly cofactor RimP [Pedobacter sp.]